MNGFDIMHAMNSIPSSYIVAVGRRLGYHADGPLYPMRSHRSIRRSLMLAAAVAIIVAACFTTAFAFSEDFRNTVFTFFNISDEMQTEKPIPENETSEITEPDVNALLEKLIHDYMTAKETDFQSETHIDLSEFYIPEKRAELEDQLSWKVFRFEKYVRLSIVDKILWEKLSYTIHETEINELSATVRVNESYEYELAAAEGRISSRGTELIITCSMEDGKWFISHIDTDNKLIEDHVAPYTAEELAELAGYSE